MRMRCQAIPADLNFMEMRSLKKAMLRVRIMAEHAVIVFRIEVLYKGASV